MLAYYLTGDLRFREVVVDEWQRTLLTDRANPQFRLADRSSGVGREASNSLGELLDLYQLTHHPAILGYLPKVMGIHLSHMTTWGLPNLNIVLLYGSEQAKQQILDAVQDYRQTNGKPKDPHGVWTGFGYGVPALAAIIDPSTKAYVDAWAMANVGARRSGAQRLRAQEPGARAFCDIPDHLLYLPWTLYVVARGGGDLSPNALKAPQPMVTTRAIVKEETDQEFEIALNGTVGEGGITLTVTGPDGKQVLSAAIPAGDHKPFTLRVPKDGVTGEYVITVPRREPKDRILVPLTRLPEVYVPNDAAGKPGWWWQHAQTTYFTRSRGDKPEVLEINPHGMSAGSIVSRDGMETLAATGDGKTLKVEIGPAGVWFIMKSSYVGVKSSPVLSVTPEQWFLPGSLAQMNLLSR